MPVDSNLFIFILNYADKVFVIHSIFSFGPNLVSIRISNGHFLNEGQNLINNFITNYFGYHDLTFT